MATLTLGQMLDAALGSSRAGAIDFEQLHNLLNGMLLHLGLRDLLVQESGEPLEGAEGSPFSASFLEELKNKVEANEKEITEVRALCQELREEVNEMKVEQSRMAEDMQKFQENFDVENFQNMLEELRNQLLDAVMSSMKDMMTQDEQDSWLKDGLRHKRPWDDPGLIVIGNEITLVERSKTPIPRHGDTPLVSPLPPNAKTQGRGKDLLEANASSHPVSFRENDMGQNVGWNDVGWNMGQSDMGRKGMGWNVGQKDMRRNVQWGDTGQNDMGQKDTGWNMGQSDLRLKGMGWNVGQRDMGRNVRSSNTGRNDMGQDDMGQIKDEDIKMSISKKQSPDGGFTASGMHPGAPGTHLQVQRVQSVQGHPGSQTPESVAGTSKMLLKMPSSEYSPCDQIMQLPGRHSEIIPSTPPPSPGLSGRLPRTVKQNQKQEHREQAADGYSRRSPRYCGGKHTSTYPVQPMEPLLPDPNKPGAFDLVGTDGLVYRGRTALRVDSACDSSRQK